MHKAKTVIFVVLCTCIGISQSQIWSMSPARGPFSTMYGEDLYKIFRHFALNGSHETDEKQATFEAFFTQHEPKVCIVAWNMFYEQYGQEHLYNIQQRSQASDSDSSEQKISQSSYLINQADITKASKLYQQVISKNPKQLDYELALAHDIATGRCTHTPLPEKRFVDNDYDDTAGCDES